MKVDYDLIIHHAVKFLVSYPIGVQIGLVWRNSIVAGQSIRQQGGGFSLQKGP